MLQFLAAFGLALLFAYAMSWLGVYLGQLTPTVETAQQVAFTAIFPITFVSNAFVPLQSLPGWLQPFAEWNPVSTLTASMRELFGNPNPVNGTAFPSRAPDPDDRDLVRRVRGDLRPARGPALPGHLEVTVRQALSSSQRLGFSA